jgi:excisionase family DNA binding protein
MQTVTTDQELVTTPEAGRRLGITTREVYDLIDAGDLPVVRTDDGPQVPVSAIDARRSE